MTDAIRALADLVFQLAGLLAIASIIHDVYQFVCSPCWKSAAPPKPTPEHPTDCRPPCLQS
jgi:hypothetical protein